MLILYLRTLSARSSWFAFLLRACRKMLIFFQRADCQCDRNFVSLKYKKNSSNSGGELRADKQEPEAKAWKEVIFHAGRQGRTDVPEDVHRTELP